MLIPIGSSQPQGDPPIFTGFIIIFCVLLHIFASPRDSAIAKLDTFCASHAGQELTEALGKDCAYAINKVLKGEVKDPELKRAVLRAERDLDIWGWKVYDPKNFSLIALVMHIFFHDGWRHLIGNMFFLWIFGRVLEDLVGSVEFGAIFVGSAVFAAVMYTVFSLMGLSGGAPTLGASGGVYGVMAGIYRKFPKLGINCLFWFISIVKTVTIPAIYLIGFYVFMDVLSLLTSSGRGVNFIAHLAGFGIVYAMLEPFRTRTSVEL